MSTEEQLERGWRARNNAGGQWRCSCGQPWSTLGHRARMRGDIDNNSLWRGSPALLVPYRQWARERLPRGSKGVVIAGDDGFLRGFKPGDPHDIGVVAPWEWKTFGALVDEPTRRALGAMVLGDRIVGALIIRLIGGNVPGPLTHYPVPRCIAEGDWLPEQPVVAERIEFTDLATLRFDEPLTETELVAELVATVQRPADGS